MNKNNVIVRNAELKDIKRIFEIYSYYIENTAITFECSVPSYEEFQNRITRIMNKFPFVVLEENGKVKGYAYADTFKEREAYSRACEVSIYVECGSQNCGFGRKLYEKLENDLTKKGMLNIYACVAFSEYETKYLSKNSVEFHEHLGYEKVGMFHNCGHKFNHWYDVVYMEKIIGTYF